MTPLEAVKKALILLQEGIQNLKELCILNKDRCNLLDSRVTTLEKEVADLKNRLNNIEQSRKEEPSDIIFGEYNNGAGI